ncbi:hypothetical protein IWQ56_004177 [Coemansia nantahalensis]|nr:hypothetical protein IWQ56_004177 [Coemansia nantahalensis]KAJ2793454.1 hypothetical protein H4R21_005892 [Coemansia helicoidea]
MDLEPGKPVFLEELVHAADAHVGRTVRVTGTLHSYVPARDCAMLVDGQNLLAIDTQLLGVQQYHVGQTYQLIGVVTRVEEGGAAPAAEQPLPEDTQCAAGIALRARVVKDADGLDMAIYRRAVHALRRLLDGPPQPPQ